MAEVGVTDDPFRTSDSRKKIQGHRVMVARYLAL